MNLNGNRNLVTTLPDNAFQAFLESRKSMGLTKSALGNYSDRLFRALAKIGNPYNATYANIQSYLNTIPPSRERLYNRLSYYKVLKTFYNWLDKVYDLPNPMGKMEAPKIGKFILPTLNEVQISALLDRVSSESQKRDRAIITLFIDSGLRLTELANVKVEDINWKDHEIRTIGKGRKEAYAPFSEFSERYLREWMFESNISAGKLFPLNRWGINIMLKRLEVRTGIKCNAHVFRRTFATLLRKKGVDVLDIQQLGRWENVEMVQRYTKAFTFREAKKHYKSPLADLIFK
jgi:site-specific recombinase XerD